MKLFLFRHKVSIVCVFALILTMVAVDLQAQRWKFRRYEAGFGLGTAQIFADIGGTADQDNLYGLKDVKFDETRFSLGGFLRYKIQPSYSVKANLYAGMGRGTDADSRNDRGREYTTTLVEFSGQFEYYILKEDKVYRSSAMYNKKGMLNNYNSLALYGFLGFGVTYSNTSHVQGTVLIHDDYKPGGNITGIVPVGLGAKMIIDDRVSFGGEFGYRLGISDYLEGYKNITNSKRNDVYYFFMITMNYRLRTTRRNLPAFIDRKYRRLGY